MGIRIGEDRRRKKNDSSASSGRRRHKPSLHATSQHAKGSGKNPAKGFYGYHERSRVSGGYQQSETRHRSSGWRGGRKADQGPVQTRSRLSQTTQGGFEIGKEGGKDTRERVR